MNYNFRCKKVRATEKQEFQLGAYMTNGILIDDEYIELFAALREQNVLMEEHSGGCVLFERRETVEALLAENAGK